MTVFRRGDYKVVCDRTGAVVNASDCVLQWDGAFVLKHEADKRHPQDTPAVARDSKRPANPRPEGTMQFIAATDVTSDDL